ncbi:hypothetical protein M0R01_00090 [bacterium]|nr:hypothetical protein [bacterium]
MAQVDYCGDTLYARCGSASVQAGNYANHPNQPTGSELCRYGTPSSVRVSTGNAGQVWIWSCWGTYGGVKNADYDCTSWKSRQPACSWSCGGWGACQPGNVQYRSCSSSPAGCTGGNPNATSQWCQYTPACSWSCGGWGACQPGNVQYRSCSSSPAGCTGGNPYPTSQSCTYTLPSCTYSCGSWSGCSGSSHTQSRTCSANNTPCSGSTSYNEYAGCTPSCTYSCGSWSGCSGSSHTQSRTCSANNTPCSGSTSYNENTSCTPSCTYSYGSWSTCSASTYTQTRTATANNTPCSGNTSFIQTQSCTPTINGECGTANNKTYAYDVTSYGSDTQCSSGTSSNTAFPNQGSIVIWTCGGSGGGANRDCAAGRNPAPIPIAGSCGPAAMYYPADATAYIGNQCTSGTPSNTAFPTAGSSVSWTCSGQYGGADSTTCTASRASVVNNSIALSQFKNAFDLLPTDTKSGSEEQCLWCEWYEKSTLVSGINETGLGKAGTLGFSFYYQDNINYRLNTISLLVNTVNNIAGGVEITVPKNSDPANTVSFGESLAPFVKVDNTVSALTLDTANNTIKIPYNGNTYYWFVKVTNTNGDDSGWVSATGKQITTPDHKWPTVAIQPAKSEIIIGANNQFCSTSSFSPTDPCYSTCWKGTGTPTLSDLTNKDKWKCSVCYSTDGSPILCQSKPTVTFNWQDGGTTMFPLSTEQSWWKYSGENGRQTMNPVIRPKTASAKIKLNITGSDCPFGGSITGSKINPTWKEKN